MTSSISQTSVAAGIERYRDREGNSSSGAEGDA